MIFSNGATQRSTKPYPNGLLVFKHEAALCFPNAGKLPLCLTCFHKNFGVPTGETVSGARYVWHQASSNKRTPWEKHIFNRRIYESAFFRPVLCPVVTLTAKLPERNHSSAHLHHWAWTTITTIISSSNIINMGNPKPNLPFGNGL